MTINEIENSLKEVKLVPYGLNSLTNFVNGNVSITKAGNLKLTIELPKEALNTPGIPMRLTDFKLVPLVLFCEHEKQEEEK